MWTNERRGVWVVGVDHVIRVVLVTAAQSYISRGETTALRSLTPLSSATLTPCTLRPGPKPTPLGPHTTTMLALLALLPLLAFPAFASPTPLSKRYTNVRIRSNRSGLCLSAAPKTGVGSQVTVTSCDDFWAHTWTINPGSGSVLLGDGSSGLALDAGTNPADGGKLKVWTSYPGLYQQT